MLWRGDPHKTVGLAHMAKTHARNALDALVCQWCASAEPRAWRDPWHARARLGDSMAPIGGIWVGPEHA